MDNITSQDDLKQIFTDLQRLYFNDFWLIHMFFITITQNYLLLKLLYGVFSQKRFQHKLVPLPLQCNLESDLQLILYDVYKNNLELESRDYKITRWEFLRARVDFFLRS